VIKAEPSFNPPRLLTGFSTRILKYVEDLKRGFNADVGPKDYFEIASNIRERIQQKFLYDFPDLIFSSYF
jgi:hypothetical protein